MKVGQSAPRYSELVSLFSQSETLRVLLARYFTAVVKICHRIVNICQQSVLSQAKSFIQGLDISKFESDLAYNLNSIKEQLYLEQYREARSSRGLVQEIHAWTSGKKSAQIICDHMRLLDMCSTFDYRSPWRRIRKQGNATWMFDLLEYRDWADSARSGALILKGKLGSGKSVLLANVVDDMVLRRPTAPVIYFFCCEDNPKSLNSRTILGSIARQLLETLPTEEKSQITRKVQGNLDEDGILNLLSSTFAARDMVFLVLDALDECNTQERNSLLRAIEQLQQCIRLAVCLSEPLGAEFTTEKNTKLKGSRWSISLPEKRPDIRQYIEDRLLAKLEDGSLSVGDPNIILEIRDALDTGSQGM